MTERNRIASGMLALLLPKEQIETSVGYGIWLLSTMKAVAEYGRQRSIIEKIFPKSYHAEARQ